MCFLLIFSQYVNKLFIKFLNCISHVFDYFLIFLSTLLIYPHNPLQLTGTFLKIGKLRFPHIKELYKFFQLRIPQRPPHPRITIPPIHLPELCFHPSSQIPKKLILLFPNNFPTLINRQESTKIIIQGGNLSILGDRMEV